jgi:dihydroorotate dehydrogenase electron transfer subunit
VAAVRVENERTRTLFFEEQLPSRPGQFVMAWLPGVDERPFSIAAPDPLALTVAAVGPFSTALHRLEAGDRLWIRGPLGQGFEIWEGHLLLVGGGYGVAPLLFLAREAIAAGSTVEACVGARTAGEVLLVEELQAAGAAVSVATEDGSLGTCGLVSAPLEAAVARRRPDGVYACGPAGMLEAIDRLCERSNLSCQLSWEGCMRCGIGLCGSCERPALRPGSGGEAVVRRGSGWLVCLDGPVDKKQFQPFPVGTVDDTP